MYNFTILRLKYKSCAKYVEPPVRPLVYKDVAWNRNSHYWKGGQALGGGGGGAFTYLIGYVYLNEIFLLNFFWETIWILLARTDNKHYKQEERKGKNC